MNNILITSLSKKIPLIKAVKDAANKFSLLHGKQINVYGMDSSPDCLGKYFVDTFFECPLDEDLTFEWIVNYCKDNDIHMIIPTRDYELQFYADNYSLFCENEILVMVSESQTIGICQDKLIFSQYLEQNNLPSVPTVSCINDIDASQYVIKENYGGDHTPPIIISDPNKIIAITTKFNYPIIQPYIEGLEISVDMYVARKSKLKGIILRTRDRIINGESQITTTFKCNGLERLFTRLIGNFGFYGHIIAQAIIDKDDKPYILEVNPRLGGASTLSIAAGLDSIYWFIMESHGMDISKDPFINSKHGMKLIRHPQDLILEGKINDI